MSKAPKTSREWQQELSACKAENQALAEALQACLPLVDDAAQEMALKKIGASPGLQQAIDAVIKNFGLQATHIRSLLGLPQP